MSTRLSTTLIIPLIASGLLTAFLPRAARAKRPTWGTGSGWSAVSTTSRTACELKALEKFKKYEAAGKLQNGTVRRLRMSGVEGRIQGKDAMFVLLCAPDGDAVYVFDVCPVSVCRESSVINLRNELGQTMVW
ncbi:hypothetical protein BJP36_28780 [Moorena producens JHB]|uniref:Uncharacterized protein n=1 Tax=Moorena producens (strain JHB) TaxID=1454205 RepID=A0A1D9G7D9_MOOP1|nr:hypothetical protein [Moorena producens]AOY83320.1 hypothetical protein BJP36_28780 [Moorena producens JHB]